MTTGHEATTKGGWIGHWLRRALHMGMVAVPWLYYTFRIPSFIVWILLALVVLVEIVRLSVGFQAFGQRAHEARRISSFAWGAVSLFLVLLMTTPPFAYPIIATCAFADPLIGELRRFRFSSWFVACVGILLASGLWLLAWWWLGTPWWWAILMGPLTVGAEWPNLKWIDDNAMIQLVPLAIVLIVNAMSMN